MVKTREDFFHTKKGMPIGKDQLYGLIVDLLGAAVLDEGGNEQVGSLQLLDGQLRVVASQNGSSANSVVATIAINTALSAAVDLGSRTLVGISMPAGWDAASITFDVSNDGINFGPMFFGGSEYTLSEAAASRRITVDPLSLLAWRYVKVRSGISGTTVNQTAARTITLWTKPV
ncbi:MAG: hypothetical protein NC238_03050 [Dehalobacter sp.]|nr:hypothetical protein [Dehalobacter sp.]